MFETFCRRAQNLPFLGPVDFEARLFPSSLPSFTLNTDPTLFLFPNMSTSAAAPSPVSILKKSSKSSSSSASALNPPTKTPSSSLTAEARLLESQLPLPPKKERKPKRPRVEVTDSTGAAKPSSKRAKKDEVEDLPVVEGKKAEKKRLRAEAQAAGPPLPPVEKTPLVWDTEKNGRNPYEDERLSEAAKKGMFYELNLLPKSSSSPSSFPSLPSSSFCSYLSTPSRLAVAIGYSQTIQNPYLKFQKARQNFLLRHIYNENEVRSSILFVDPSLCSFFISATSPN